MEVKTIGRPRVCLILVATKNVVPSVVPLLAKKTLYFGDSSELNASPHLTTSNVPKTPSIN